MRSSTEKHVSNFKEQFSKNLYEQLHAQYTLELD